MPRTAETDRICGDCWDRALFAYGTAQIFLKRSRRYRAYLRRLAFIGIAGPLVIGGMVIHHLVSPKHLDVFVWVVSLIAVIEALLSLWSLVATWADNLSYSQGSTTENLALASAFRELGEQGPDPRADLELKFTELRSRDDARRASDAQQDVTEKEKRRAHHAGLLHFKKRCEGCGQTPTSMDSSSCGVCGRFSMFKQLKFWRKTT